MLNGLTRTLNELNFSYKTAQKQLDYHLKEKVELEETKEELEHLIDSIKADETVIHPPLTDHALIIILLLFS